MIKVACSTGIRSTESLDVACQAIVELGFRYVDPLAYRAEIEAGAGA